MGAALGPVRRGFRLLRRARTATILSGHGPRIDPQVHAQLASAAGSVSGETETPPVGDVEARRISGHRMMDHVAATSAPVEGVDTERFVADRQRTAQRWTPPGIGRRRASSPAVRCCICTAAA